MTMPDVPISDEARRCSEQINLHVLAGNYSQSGYEVWVAIRLSDGGSDGVAYHSRQAAIFGQLHEKQCGYILVPPTGMTPVEAERFMRFIRKVQDAGGNLADPNVHHAMPTRLEFL